MLTITGLSKSFGQSNVLKQVSLEIDSAEHFFILGPSGSGKSTLLKIIAGLECPDSGTVILNGKNITTDPPEQRPIHTVFQNYALFPHLNVKDNIAFSLKLRNVNTLEINDRVDKTLRMVKLNGYQNRKIEQLSGGEQQRVAIARALVNRPQVLLLDEPLSAIDEQLRRQLLSDLREIKQQLSTIFIHVTHHQEEAFALADRIAVLQNGEVAQVGSSEAIYRTPVNRQVAEFIGRAVFLPATITNGICRLQDGTAVSLAKQPEFSGKAVLSVRPENFQVHNDDRFSKLPGQNELDGVLVERLFNGNIVELKITTKAGLLAALTTFNLSLHLIDGSPIWLSWQAQDSILFKDNE